jgi:hypothetical protein
MIIAADYTFAGHPRWNFGMAQSQLCCSFFGHCHSVVLACVVGCWVHGWVAETIAGGWSHKLGTASLVCDY